MIKLYNQTREPIKIKQKSGSEIVIPRLGEVHFSERDFKNKFTTDQLETLQNQNQLGIKNDALSPLSIALGLDFWIAIIGGIVGFFSNINYYWWGYLAAITLLPLCTWLYSRLKQSREETRADRQSQSDTLLQGTVVAFFRQVLTLSAMIVISVGIPAVTLHFSEDYFFLNLKTSLSPEQIGKMLQLLIIGIASVLPPLLYFLFDRHFLSTLRSDFYNHVMTLNPELQTIEEAEALYQKKIQNFYGKDESAYGQILNQTRLPILLCTGVITFGWMIAIPFNAPLAMAGSQALYDFFVPQESPMIFGFLGAYFFGINMIFRRYLRSDLRPKAYTHILVRILITFILSWFFAVLLPDQKMISISIAFMVGILPDTWIVFFKEVGKASGGLLAKLTKGTKELEEEHPLTNLEGINLYHRARLIEEGVENIENLANHDLEELMLKTRIPAAVLIDWMDQAILYLHTYRRVADETTSRLLLLKGYGIRTASDLLRTWALCDNDEDRAQFLNIISTKEGTIHPLRVIICAIKDDEWIKKIMHWRYSKVACCQEELVHRSA